MSRSLIRAAALVAALLSTACGDRGGFEPRQAVAPRYGDFVIPVDSFTAPDRVRSGDTVEVRVFPRAPYSDCSHWVLITNQSAGVRLTLYGVFGLARGDSSACHAPVSRFALAAFDRPEIYPIAVFQPDDSRLLRRIVVEPVPLPIRNDTLPAVRDSQPPRTVEKHKHKRRRPQPPRAPRDPTLTPRAPGL